MHKTIYIEADEEITSIIDRIKKEGSPDIFIVVPKNAMLVQGVINLKLLKKEAVKIKKNIILVTNDKQAKKVIGRIGFEIKESLSAEEMESTIPDEEIDEVEQVSLDSIEEIDMQEKKSVGQREIGSSSFFADGGDDGLFDEEIDEVDEIEETMEVSPDKVIKKMDMIKNQKDPKENRRRMIKKSKKEKANAEILAKRKRKEVEEIFGEDIDFDNEELQGSFSDQKAEQFFNQRGNKNDHEIFSKKAFSSKKNSTPKKPKKKINILFAIGLFLILALLGFGGWVYVNWPKMSVVIYPKENNISSITDVEILDDLENSNFEEGKLPGKMEEFEIKKTLEFDATGEKYSSDQGKARGKVVIYNKYSSAEQPLVATTRVLSEEGKLFRLIDSVQVPGMEDDEPGKIEVKVIADEPGEDFNIEASTFTIEGFKGNPKYEKFEVISESSMTGGSDSSDNNLVKYVTDSDIEKARLKTLEEIEKSFEQEVEASLSNFKGYIVDSAKKEVIENNSSFDSGDVTEKFDYTIKQKVRLMTFSKEDLLKVAQESLSLEIDSDYEVDQNEIRTEIIKNVVDFENKTMSLRVEVFGIAWPNVDQGTFKKEIADQKEEEFQNILKNYQEIKKVDIEYSPGWLSGIAVSENKINVTEEKVISED